MYGSENNYSGNGETQLYEGMISTFEENYWNENCKIYACQWAVELAVDLYGIDMQDMSQEGSDWDNFYQRR